MTPSVRLTPLLDLLDRCKRSSVARTSQRYFAGARASVCYHWHHQGQFPGIIVHL